MYNNSSQSRGSGSGSNKSFKNKGSDSKSNSGFKKPFKKDFSKPGDDNKPFRAKSSKFDKKDTGFGKRDDDRPKRTFDKPNFKKREDREGGIDSDSKPDRERRFDKPKREGDRPFADRSKRTFDKPNYRKREDREEGSADRDRDSKFDKPKRADDRPFADRPKRTFDKPNFRKREDREEGSAGADRERKFDKPKRADDRPFADRPKRTFDKPNFKKREDREEGSAGGDRGDRKFDKPKRTFDKPIFKKREDRDRDREGSRDADAENNFDSSDNTDNHIFRESPKRTAHKKDFGSKERTNDRDRDSNRDNRDSRDRDRDSNPGKPARKFEKSRTKDDRPFRDRPKKILNRPTFRKPGAGIGENIEVVIIPKIEKKTAEKKINDEDATILGLTEDTTSFEAQEEGAEAEGRKKRIVKKKAEIKAPANKKSRRHEDDEEDEEDENGEQGAESMPLNKYIAHSGECSRRDAAEIVKQGKVKVNGELVTDPGYKVQDEDKVTLAGKKLTPQKGNVYILLNKPRGFITTNDDPQGRRTVMDLVANSGANRLYPIGRLDRDTTGLILLTNDGDLTQKLSHPSFEIKKVYQVTLDKPLTKDDFEKVMAGVELEDGKAKVDELAYLEKKNEIGLEIHSGKNRIVRRIFESLKYEVEKLDRVMYAGLTKKNLPRSKWRFLDEREIVLLKHFKS